MAVEGVVNNMEHLVPETEEAELKIQTIMMFKHGGVENVLKCVQTMQQVQIIILKKLNEILDNER